MFVLAAYAGRHEEIVYAPFGQAPCKKPFSRTDRVMGVCFRIDAVRILGGRMDA